MANVNSGSRVSPDAIERARGRINPEFLDSRQFEDDGLSAAVGARVICKIEIENAVGSFKGRGADSLVSALPSDSKTLITASAGNFGLALAYAAKRRGITTTVYAAETASPMKLDRIRSLGAEVKLAGRDFDEAKGCGRAAAERMRIRFVEDGGDPETTAGAGTVAMEITRWPQPINSMFSPKARRHRGLESASIE